MLRDRGTFAFAHAFSGEASRNRACDPVIIMHLCTVPYLLSLPRKIHKVGE